MRGFRTKWDDTCPVYTHGHTHTGIYPVTVMPLLHISQSSPQLIRHLLEQQSLPLSFLLPPQHPLPLRRDGKLGPMKMLAYHEKAVEALFSPVPNCWGGGKGGASWQRLYKYLLSSNTAGRRAPSFSWLLCQPREISAGTGFGTLRAHLLTLNAPIESGPQPDLPYLSI